MRNNLVKSIAPKVLMPPVLVGRAQRGHIQYNIKQQMSSEGQSRCGRLQGICASCRLIAFNILTVAFKLQSKLFDYH